MGNRRNGTPCTRCGHPDTEHWVPYKKINTPEEYYECAHCDCRMHGDDIPVPAGFIRVNGIWDYAENAWKYK